ncbi:hypothetical protein D7X98_12830 [bacterium 1XD8-76]|nr:hypothetical protein D7X98_12830 [bacterium 1XD8-76]
MKLPLHEFPFVKATAPFSLGNFTVWLHLKSVLLFQKTKLEKFLFDEAEVKKLTKSLAKRSCS